jgi:hypothetical protein
MLRRPTHILHHGKYDHSVKMTRDNFASQSWVVRNGFVRDSLADVSVSAERRFTDDPPVWRTLYRESEFIRFARRAAQRGSLELPFLGACLVLCCSVSFGVSACGLMVGFVGLLLMVTTDLDTGTWDPARLLDAE